MAEGATEFALSSSPYLTYDETNIVRVPVNKIQFYFQRANTTIGYDGTFLTNVSPKQGHKERRHSTEGPDQGSCSEDGTLDSDDDGSMDRMRLAPSFTDYESSDRVLTDLEDRIKAWHVNITAEEQEGRTKKKQAKPTTVKMHRLSVEV